MGRTLPAYCQTTTLNIAFVHFTLFTFYVICTLWQQTVSHSITEMSGICSGSLNVHFALERKRFPVVTAVSYTLW